MRKTPRAPKESLCCSCHAHSYMEIASQNLRPRPPSAVITDNARQSRARGAELSVSKGEGKLGFSTTDSATARCCVLGQFSTGSWTAPPSSQLPPGWPRAEKGPAGPKICDLQPARAPGGTRGMKRQGDGSKDKKQNKHRDKLTRGRVGEKKKEESSYEKLLKEISHILPSPPC